MMNTKAVFLDRDGTINVEKKYLYRIADFEYLPRSLDGLKLFQDAGYLLIIITNQSGIARGLFSEDDYNRLNAWMLKDLASKGINIKKVYMCPHLACSAITRYRIHCSCRKPKLGLFFRAIQDYSINLSNSVAIGDNERDLSICSISKCRGYIIDPSKTKQLMNQNLTRVNNIYEAALVALGHNHISSG